MEKDLKTVLRWKLMTRHNPQGLFLKSLSGESRPHRFFLQKARAEICYNDCYGNLKLRILILGPLQSGYRFLERKFGGSGLPSGFSCGTLEHFLTVNINLLPLENGVPKTEKMILVSMQAFKLLGIEKPEPYVDLIPTLYQETLFFTNCWITAGQKLAEKFYAKW